MHSMGSDAWVQIKPLSRTEGAWIFMCIERHDAGLSSIRVPEKMQMQTLHTCARAPASLKKTSRPPTTLQRTFQTRYIYIHTYIPAYIHTCIHACMYAYIHTYVCIHTYDIWNISITHNFASMYIRIHISIYTYIHIYICI